MNQAEAEAMKERILERRNYLKALNVPLVYSKINLHGGMQNRVGRQNDRAFKNRVVKQKSLMDKNLNIVNNYINDLNRYNSSQSKPEGEIAVMSQSSQKVSSPIAFNLTLPPMPQRNRPVRQGLGGSR